MVFESEFTVTEKEKVAYIDAIKKHITEEGKDASLLKSIKLSLRATRNPARLSTSLKVVPLSVSAVSLATS